MRGLYCRLRQSVQRETSQTDRLVFMPWADGTVYHSASQTAR